MDHVSTTILQRQLETAGDCDDLRVFSRRGFNNLGDPEYAMSAAGGFFWFVIIFITAVLGRSEVFDLMGPKESRFRDEDFLTDDPRFQNHRSAEAHETFMHKLISMASLFAVRTLLAAKMKVARKDISLLLTQQLCEQKPLVNQQSTGVHVDVTQVNLLKHAWTKALVADHLNLHQLASCLDKALKASFSKRVKWLFRSLHPLWGLKEFSFSQPHVLSAWLFACRILGAQWFAAIFISDGPVPHDGCEGNGGMGDAVGFGIAAELISICIVVPFDLMHFRDFVYTAGLNERQIDFQLFTWRFYDALLVVVSFLYAGLSILFTLCFLAQVSKYDRDRWLASALTSFLLALTISPLIAAMTVSSLIGFVDVMPTALQDVEAKLGLRAIKSEDAKEGTIASEDAEMHHSMHHIISKEDAKKNKQPPDKGDSVEKLKSDPDTEMKRPDGNREDKQAANGSDKPELKTANGISDAKEEEKDSRSQAPLPLPDSGGEKAPQLEPALWPLSGRNAVVRPTQPKTMTDSDNSAKGGWFKCHCR